MRVASWSARDRADPLLDRPRGASPGRPRRAAPARRARAPSRRVAVGGARVRRLDHHDMGELGQLGAAARAPWRAGSASSAISTRLPESARMKAVSSALVLRVDRGGGRAGAQHAEVGEDPLDPGGGGDRDPLLGPHAQLDQPGGDGVHPLGGLRPAQRPPVVGALARGGRHRIAVRLGVGRGLDALQEERRHGRRPVLDQGLCVAHDILRGPRQCLATG